MHHRILDTNAGKMEPGSWEAIGTAHHLTAIIRKCLPKAVHAKRDDVAGVDEKAPI